jgi:hypothetical protein
MHNGKGIHGRGPDRFAQARRQKKYRRRRKQNLRVLNIDADRDILTKMVKAIMEKNGVMDGSPDEFLKFLMVHLVSNWLAAHWKSVKEREHRPLN